MLLAMALIGNGAYASTADQELLDILLKNGSINKTQYKSMVGKEGLASSQLLEILSKNGAISKDQSLSNANLFHVSAVMPSWYLLFGPASIKALLGSERSMKVR